MNVKNQSILFYDGDCGFCNQVVSIVLNHEANHELLFSALQSDFAREQLPNYVNKKDYLDSFKIKSGTQVFEKSKAFFFLIRYHLKWYWKPLLIFNLFPLSIVDKVYDLIANNRQRIMRGKCYVPTKEQRVRFMTDKN